MAIDFSPMTDILHNEFGHDVTYTYADATTAVVNAVKDSRDQEYETAENVMVNDSTISFHIKASLLTRAPERKDNITEADGALYDVLSYSMDSEGIEYIIRVSKVDA